MTLRQCLVAGIAALLVVGAAACQDPSPEATPTTPESQEPTNAIDERFTTEPFTSDEISALCTALETSAIESTGDDTIVVDTADPLNYDAQCTINHETEPHDLVVLLKIHVLEESHLEEYRTIQSEEPNPLDECEFYQRVGYNTDLGDIKSIPLSPGNGAEIRDTDGKEYCDAGRVSGGTSYFATAATFVAHRSQVVLEFNATWDSIKYPEPPVQREEVEALSDAVMEAVLAGL